MKQRAKNTSFSPKKSLGQNFLTENHFIEKILCKVRSLSQEYQTHHITEIGPGTGALTRPLLQSGLQVTSIEKDGRAVLDLKEKLAPYFPNTFSLLESDILKWLPFEEKISCLVGNIPYYITSNILIWFHKHRSHFFCGLFMVQEEVADRLQAKIGTKDYGRLTIKIQLHFQVEKLFQVPATAFFPKPKVHSAIILLTPKITNPFLSGEEEKFEKFTAFLFASRRKMIRKTIENFLSSHGLKITNMEEFWQSMGKIQISPDLRPDAISPELTLKLFRGILAASNSETIS